jgi:6-pyruvoyltetrahydropterin/6-carboxytetrahydropterin synthase
MRLGVVEYIDCAHTIPGHPKCGSLHGHTYKVELIIEGETRDSRGMIVDFGRMKRDLREVLAKFDHRSWNEFLDFPTVENICELLAKSLEPRLEHPFHLKVWEGEGKWAEL